MSVMKALIRSWPLPIGLIALLALPAHAQIKRWVDERGIVHYSNVGPQPNERVASPVTELAPAQPITVADPAQGQQRWRQEPASPTPNGATPGLAPRGDKPAPEDPSCAGHWARYNAAYACLNPYRAQGGAIRAEGFSKCPVVKQPECAPPESQ